MSHTTYPSICKYLTPLFRQTVISFIGGTEEGLFDHYSPTFDGREQQEDEAREQQRDPNQTKRICRAHHRPRGQWQGHVQHHHQGPSNPRAKPANLPVRERNDHQGGCGGGEIRPGHAAGLRSVKLLRFRSRDQGKRKVQHPLHPKGCPNRRLIHQRHNGPLPAADEHLPAIQQDIRNQPQHQIPHGLNQQRRPLEAQPDRPSPASVGGRKGSRRIQQVRRELKRNGPPAAGRNPPEVHQCGPQPEKLPESTHIFPRNPGPKRTGAK